MITVRLRRRLIAVVAALFTCLAAWLSGCQPAASPTVQPAPEQSASPLPTQPPTQQPTPPAAERTSPPAPTQLPPAEVVIEPRIIDVEWPRTLRWGDSDTVRLRLLPDGNDYLLEAEFPEHDIQSQPLPVERPDGYFLSAVARLDGVGFTISPAGEQERQLPPGEGAVWHWSLTPNARGQQRLTIQLALQWTPSERIDGSAYRRDVFSRGLDIQVTTFLGMTANQSFFFGILGMLLGSGLSLASLLWKNPRLRAGFIRRLPSAALVIEPHAAITLDGEEERLLRGLFDRYARVLIVKEFLSGYSGARTLLVLPLHPDGQSDAYTIVKLGERESMLAEYRNYETFVKDRLPPITARIQHPPVMVPNGERAGLQYTFIAEPGRHPISLRESLLADGSPKLLVKLYETFAPNWWMQRSPYTFVLAQEYDRLMPPHLVLEPLDTRPPGSITHEVHVRSSPTALNVKIGDVVYLRSFERCETRADRRSLTLYCQPQPGKPPLRLRWMAARPPNRGYARVAATRASLLAGWTSRLDLAGLPDPLPRLPELQDRTVHGTRSIIHGDLNVENVLVGPGGFVWLIDFAHTRQGHTLFDFVHLEMELITQVIAPTTTPAGLLCALERGDHLLLTSIDHLCHQCLFNPDWEEELALARVMTLLGGLKYANLSDQARQLLYLAAAYRAQSIPA